LGTLLIGLRLDRLWLRILLRLRDALVLLAHLLAHCRHKYLIVAWILVLTRRLRLRCSDSSSARVHRSLPLLLLLL
jgi:hypothetical protein